jgi:RHS repeat-associated protein
LSNLPKIASSAIKRQSYNGDGLRFQKIDAGGVVTNYVLDQLNVLLEKNSSGATTTRHVPTVARIVGTDIRYYLEDRLGSVVALVDSTQTITDTFRYDAWGNLLVQQGSTSTPYQWVGKEAYYLISDVGFYLLGLRFYLPVLGRFVTRDPIGFKAGDWSQYRYVFNQATVLTDSSGLLTAKLPYFCFDPFFRGVCVGICTCNGLPSLLPDALMPFMGCSYDVLLLATADGCCKTTCGPAAQPAKMISCLQIAFRALFGPQVTCTCT